MPRNNPLNVSQDSQTWTLEYLLSTYSNFEPIPRVSVQTTSSVDLSKLIKTAETKGIPLIVEALYANPNWDASLLSPEWFQNHSPNADIQVRNLNTREDSEVPLGSYLSQCQQDKPVDLYAKDIPCPQEWRSWLPTVVPGDLLPLGRDDLMRHFPPNELPENLMCYLGTRGTFTPCHKDLCASVGQNLMSYAMDDASAFWFMSTTGASDDASDFFRSLGHELDHETHFASLEELQAAPFTVYVCRQQLGDLIVSPPRSCHQVVNHGGFSIKTSWSRMTLRSLQLALTRELPIYHRICRPEVYCVKSLAFYSMSATARTLQSIYEDPTSQPGKKFPTASLLVELLKIADDILAEEYAGPARLRHMASQELTGALSCDFCGADIFQSFFRCGSAPSCQPATSEEEGDPIMLCPMCYVEGRSCPCDCMQPAQVTKRKLADLIGQRSVAAKTLNLQKLPMKASELNDARLVAKQPIFEAACLLHMMKSGAGSKRSTKRQSARSTTSADIVLDCQKCHARSSLRDAMHHYCVHSSQAMLAYHGMFGSWHELHSKGRNVYESAVRESSFAPSVLRVQAVLRYPGCRVSDENDGRFLLGYYDQPWGPYRPVNYPERMPPRESSARKRRPPTDHPMSPQRKRRKPVGSSTERSEEEESSRQRDMRIVSSSRASSPSRFDSSNSLSLSNDPPSDDEAQSLAYETEPGSSTQILATPEPTPATTCSPLRRMITTRSRSSLLPMPVVQPPRVPGDPVRPVKLPRKLNLIKTVTPVRPASIARQHSGARATPAPMPAVLAGASHSRTLARGGEASPVFRSSSTTHTRTADMQRPTESGVHEVISGRNILPGSLADRAPPSRPSHPILPSDSIHRRPLPESHPIRGMTTIRTPPQGALLQTEPLSVLHQPALQWRDTGIARALRPEEDPSFLLARDLVQSQVALLRGSQEHLTKAMEARDRAVTEKDRVQEATRLQQIVFERERQDYERRIEEQAEHIHNLEEQLAVSRQIEQELKEDVGELEARLQAACDASFSQQQPLPNGTNQRPRTHYRSGQDSWPMSGRVFREGSTMSSARRRAFRQDDIRSSGGSRRESSSFVAAHRLPPLQNVPIAEPLDQAESS